MLSELRANGTIVKRAGFSEARLLKLEAKNNPMQVFGLPRKVIRGAGVRRDYLPHRARRPQDASR